MANFTPIKQPTLIALPDKNTLAAGTLADGGTLSFSVKGSGYDNPPLLWATKYDSSGHKVSNEFKVSETQPSYVWQYPGSYAALKDGNFVVAWTQEFRRSGVTSDVHFQIFDQNLKMVGGEQVANKIRADAQANPTIAALNDGGFILVFDVSQFSIFGQRFSAEGRKIGDEFAIVNGRDFNINPEVFTNSDGDLLVYWNSWNTENYPFTKTVESIKYISNMVILDSGESNVLRSGSGSDTLIGNGHDTLQGLAGDDLYTVLGDGVLVEELSGGGYDTVRALVSFTLGNQVEKLVLFGAGAINGTGNALDNRLLGNDAANTLAGLYGNDTLSGGGGNDTLVGGPGADRMTGGQGADIFRFSAASEGADSITDFTGGEDALEISAAGFGGGLLAGQELARA